MTVDQTLAMERIHQVCQQTPTVNCQVLQRLVQDMPVAVEFRSPHDEWLPLHRLCRRQPSLTAVRILVQAWPDSVREWTHHNGGTTTTTTVSEEEARLPIHLAAQYGASLAVVQYLAHQDPTCLQAVSPQRMFTALDFALYYYHHSKQQGLDVTEAERVVSFLAHARVQDATEHPKKQLGEEDDKAVKASSSSDTTAMPIVRARPLTVMATTTGTRPRQQQQPPSNHYARVGYPTPRPSSYAPHITRSCTSKAPKTGGSKSSKIIRLSTLRPSVPPLR